MGPAAPTAPPSPPAHISHAGPNRGRCATRNAPTTGKVTPAADSGVFITGSRHSAGIPAEISIAAATSTGDTTAMTTAAARAAHAIPPPLSGSPFPPDPRVPPKRHENGDFPAIVAGPLQPGDGRPGGHRAARPGTGAISC
ncbi:hypothetical protein [Microbispora sp. H10830]|uniref:hypothetical protein n=1 Tax=Microbispora sp. H10830 TaxID=2729109 RepID=UPI002175E171|nr:hypothetical protein [Microbispora sp. H10830]